MEKKNHSDFSSSSSDCSGCCRRGVNTTSYHADEYHRPDPLRGRSGKLVLHNTPNGLPARCLNLLRLRVRGPVLIRQSRGAVVPERADMD